MPSRDWVYVVGVPGVYKGDLTEKDNIVLYLFIFLKKTPQFHTFYPFEKCPTGQVRSRHLLRYSSRSFLSQTNISLQKTHHYQCK